MSSFYSREELTELGLKSFGENVSISRKTSIYGAKNISIGNNVRIDDFCILSGKINIGNYIHLSAYSGLYAGNATIQIHDFAGISPRSTIFGTIDDFSGSYMIGPMIADKYRNLLSGDVILKKYVQLGAETIVFPNIIISDGTVTGAKSLVKESLDPWGIYAGIPVKKIKDRKMNIIQLEKEFLNNGK